MLVIFGSFEYFELYAPRILYIYIGQTYLTPQSKIFIYLVNKCIYYVYWTVRHLDS